MTTFATRPVSYRWQPILLVGIALFLLLREGFPLAVGLAQDSEPVAPRAPLGSSFTFQGRLTNNGVPANGPHDMQFALFDSQSGGALIEVLPLLNGVDVVNGLYSVQLSFAETAFRGQDRWLEVSARPSGPGNFTTLGRQLLTATPYALYAKVAGTADTVPWTGVQGIPPTIADGVDNDTTYSAQAPLTQVGNTFGLSTAGCVNGQVLKFQSGAWNCKPDEIGAAGAGDITAVLAGQGLTGGASSGDATLSVVFAGSGAAETAARSDHTHLGQSWIGSAVAGLAITNSSGKGLIASGPQGGLEGQSSTGSGVYGSTSSDSTSVAGVQGVNTNGIGLLGTGNSGVIGTGVGLGVGGESTNGTGVQGSSSGGYGIVGFSGSAEGVFGTSLNNFGVHGSTSGAAASGVYGSSPSSLHTEAGVRGEGGRNGVLGTGFAGVRGVSNSPFGSGVEAVSQSTRGNGLVAIGTGQGLSGAGALGRNFSNGCVAGGSANSEQYCFGVYGSAEVTAGVGVYGAGADTGVWGAGAVTGVFGKGNTWAGYFEGHTWVTQNFYAKHVLPTDATAAGTDNFIGDSVSRWTTVYSINPLNALSDARMKTDIQDMSYGLDEVLAMRPVSFTWKDNYDDHVHLGLLAQDVQVLIPEVVSVPDDAADPLGMTYSDLIPVLINAIQEQQAQIDALRHQGPDGELALAADPRVDSLEAELAALRTGHGSGGESWRFVLIGLVAVAVGFGAWAAWRVRRYSH